MQNTFETIQNLLRTKAEYQARLNLIPYEGSIDIKENSGKKYLEQVRIAIEVLHSMRHSDDIKKMVKGFMIESYIEDGAQKVEDGVYGKSITDPCLGWDKTKELIYTIAEQL